MSDQVLESTGSDRASPEHSDRASPEHSDRASLEHSDRAIVVEGDLFLSEDKYICHQCNCVTTKAAHLAHAMFSQYEWADVYTDRERHSKPGTIAIRGNPRLGQRYVVNIFGQYYPGRPKYPNSAKDGSWARANYFRDALITLSRVPDLESVAFPWGVGCGAAGGQWITYRKMIDEFAKNVDAKVTIYRLPQASQ